MEGDKMLSVFSELRDLTLLSVVVRMLLAMICGGIIGIEREFKRRPAGFRTHILICLGAAMPTLISQYLYMYMNYYTDMARLGAQVIAGMGFIGAGTIIITKGQRVKGLTTAAGLWTSAIVGLAIGMGFYEGGILATFLIFIAETLCSKLEYRIFKYVPEIHLYMEYMDKVCLEKVIQLYREKNIKIINIEITRPVGSEKHNACAIFTLRLNKQCKVNELITCVHKIDGVISVEEL